MDAMWWQAYGSDAQNKFEGEKYTISDGTGIAKRVSLGKAKNSGAGAILFAQKLGAAEVILIGYDAAKDGGKAHWHPDHIKGLPNAGVSHLWPDQFKELKNQLKINVVNCSRRTAITVFKTKPLEEVLWQTRYSES